jgi:hypothetical protein
VTWWPPNAEILAAIAQTNAKLDRLYSLITSQGAIMASDLQALTDQVNASIGVEQSAITLIQGLAADIASLKNDPAALQALADQLKTSAANLSAAITANPA